MIPTAFFFKVMLQANAAGNVEVRDLTPEEQKELHETRRTEIQNLFDLKAYRLLTLDDPWSSEELALTTFLGCLGLQSAALSFEGMLWKFNSIGWQSPPDGCGNHDYTMSPCRAPALEKMQ